MTIAELVEQKIAAAEAAAENAAKEAALKESGAAIVEALGLSECSDSRLVTIAIAAEASAGVIVIEKLHGAARVSRTDSIKLPQHRFAGLSRGKGWCLTGATGKGEFIEDYRVGPGAYRCGGSDGFARKGADVWKVEHVQVGAAVWTIAN